MQPKELKVLTCSRVLLRIYTDFILTGSLPENAIVLVFSVYIDMSKSEIVFYRLYIAHCSSSSDLAIRTWSSANSSESRIIFMLIDIIPWLPLLQSNCFLT
jgi:hypothetical protein